MIGQQSVFNYRRLLIPWGKVRGGSSGAEYMASMRPVFASLAEGLPTAIETSQGSGSRPAHSEKFDPGGIPHNHGRLVFRSLLL